MKNLESLLQSYYDAPQIFRAGRYWQAYENKIIDQIKNADLNQVRSGKYPIFRTFGFSESTYPEKTKLPLYLKLLKRIFRTPFITSKPYLPYSLNLDDIREMAYINCINKGSLSNLKPISEIETSVYGNPSDLFYIKGKRYTMQFLNYYVRLCFANKVLNLKGDEIIIELGSGSGFQIEILKKVFPNLTILCFDLPYLLVLCENYLSQTLGNESVVQTSETLKMKDLNNLEKGKIYMFGNWMFPVLKDFKFDVFWNAASFGEMEPESVTNYLSYVLGSCDYVYLLQAEKGKESTESSGVESPITYSDYESMLKGYDLLLKEDAYQAVRRLSQSGGYFQAIWKRNVNN